MTEEQLQTIKEHFLNTPDGYTISGSVRLIEQMKDNGISLANELELQKANAEQYLQDNVELHNENLFLNNENQRLREVLEFYADADWYHLKQNGEIIILKDAGEEARQALAGESNAI